MSERMSDWRHAFDHPATVWMAAFVAGLLLIAPLVFIALSRAGIAKERLRDELWTRYYSWLLLIPLMSLPVLLGPVWTIAGVAILSLLCFREYSRATGLFRDKLIGLIVVVGILCETFASVDHWYEFYAALFPLTVCSIAAVAILADQPKGYIQRVALGVLGFSLCGAAIGHMGFMANDRNYRPIVLMILLAVEVNDVFAYTVGKTLGRRKLAPNTSPSKTVAGALGAVVLTTLLCVVLGRVVFRGTPLESPVHLVAMGVIISVLGQLSDLMLSSIKRDIGIKDMGVAIPGHGGLLDRFDSLILVAPAMFHYIAYFNGVGIGFGVPRRIITGG